VGVALIAFISVGEKMGSRQLLCTRSSIIILSEEASWEYTVRGSTGPRSTWPRSTGPRSRVELNFLSVDFPTSFP
jgi:hypothetical protein